MNRRWSSQEILWGIGLLALVLAIWIQYQAPSAASSSPPVQVNTILLKPDSLPVKTGNLEGELEKLRVTERVERKTGKIVAGPDLKGILRLRNASTDQVIRPLAGAVEYADGGGTMIAPAKNRGTADFTIYTEGRLGLKPGEHTSEVIDVPFPVAALKAHRLQDIRLRLTYLSTPYTTVTISGPVVLGK